MNTYTLIASPDEGGVYIKQIQAEQPLDAFLVWAKLVQSDDSIPNLDKERFAKDVEFEASESPPALLQGVNNVWCAAVSGMWIHIVRTAA